MLLNQYRFKIEDFIRIIQTLQSDIEHSWEVNDLPLVLLKELFQLLWLF